MKTQMLYRPVGLKELELIAATGFRRFPPRLDWQPIFYPVLNEEYAIQIALDWNMRDEFSGYAGFVTCFKLPEQYLTKFPIQNVGGFQHNELWVPSEEMEEFNDKITDEIIVVKAYLGERFSYPENQELARKIKELIS